MTPAFFTTLGRGDFLAFVQALLPRGAAWTRDDGSVMAQLSQGVADALFSHHVETLNLSEIEADPRFTIELLPEWENDYGLPDPCTPLHPTLDQRRRALLAKIRAQGGQSPAYFIELAASLGYPITITEYRPFRLGVSHFGDPLLGEGWEFVWTVNAPTLTVHLFRFGVSAFGEPFWTADNTELECRLRRVAPAHTILNFHYA